MGLIHVTLDFLEMWNFAIKDNLEISDNVVVVVVWLLMLIVWMCCATVAGILWLFVVLWSFVVVF